LPEFIQFAHVPDQGISSLRGEQQHGNLTPHPLSRYCLNHSTSPFEYALRVSARARHVRMRVKPFVGLEVVIPKNFPRKQIPRILQQHEDWIIQQLNKHAHTFKNAALPTDLQLALTGESFTIQYQSLSDTTLPSRLQQHAQHLNITHYQEQDAIDLLRQWLRAQAKQLLPPLLQTLSEEYGFSYRKVSIRSQKSRWGSCSSRGTISLNDQLMFMPPDTVRYLMIHELCHTRHMNHSARFWQLVASCCADYRQQEMRLNNPGEWVPEWFTRSLHQ
jgi:predicted metal-dependent hydrolase